MNSESLVTIIIPFYNCEKFIGRCIDSVLNQTYKNIDIILINDGSTDNSCEIVKRYNDKRIRIFEQTNQGPSSARNVGLDNALGSFVMFLDGDDEYESFFVNDLYNDITSKQADISVGLCKRKNKKWCTNPEPRPEIIKIVDNNMLLSEEAEAHYTCIYKSSILANIRYDIRIDYSEDWLFYKKTLLNAKTISYVNSLGYIYWSNDLGSLVWGSFDYHNHIKKAHSSIFAHLNYAEELFSRKLDGRPFIYQSFKILIGYFYSLYKHKISFDKKDFKSEYLYIRPYLKKISIIKRIIYSFIASFPFFSFFVLKLFGK